MSPLLLPLLLLFSALGGMLVVMGRKAAGIRTAYREEAIARGSSEGIDRTLAPRTQGVERPTTSGLRARLFGVLGQGKLFALAGLRLLVRMTGKGVGLFARLFHRAPASERLPQLGTSNGSTKHIPTTADVRRLTGRILRLPEPLPRSSERTHHHAGSDQVPSAAPVPTPEQHETLTPAGVTPLPALEKDIPDVVLDELEPSAESMASPEESASIPEVPVEESPVTVETTRVVRSRRRRRVVGRVRPKAAMRKIEPPVAHEEPAEPEASFEEPLASSAEPSPANRPIGWVSTEQTIPALIEEGKFGRAESLLIDILSKDPRDTEAYKLLGTIYLRREEYPQAKEVFEEALRRDPEHAGIPGLLGATYFALGEYGKALPMYQRAHSADETNIEYLEKLLMIFSRTDRRPMVRVTAKKLLAIDPNHAEAKKVLERVGAR